MSAKASGKRMLLIVGGGVAAYKALELARLFRKAGIAVRPILTAAGAEFVTPLSLAALAEDKIYRDLFSLTDEAEMGHIELSRSADLVVVAPATADLMAKAAERPGRRSGLHDAAGHRQGGADGPGDERADVAPPGDPAQSGHACAPTASASSAQTTARWPAANSGRAAWPSPRRSSPPRWRCWARAAGAGPLAGGTFWSRPDRPPSRSTRCGC